MRKSSLPFLLAVLPALAPAQQLMLLAGNRVEVCLDTCALVRMPYEIGKVDTLASAPPLGGSSASWVALDSYRPNLCTVPQGGSRVECAAIPASFPLRHADLAFDEQGRAWLLPKAGTVDVVAFKRIASGFVAAYNKTRDQLQAELDQPFSSKDGFLYTMTQADIVADSAEDAELAAAAPATASADLPPLLVTQDDIERVTAAHRQSRKLDLSTTPSIHLDGVRGYSSSTISDYFKIQTEEQRLGLIRKRACTNSVYGEAELVQRTSFFIKDGNALFTKLRFRMWDDWRATPGNPPQMVDAVFEGGEGEYGGQRFRVENEQMRFSVGRRYLLNAGPRSEREDQALLGGLEFREIAAGRMYPDYHWFLYEPGHKVSDARADVARALAIKGCE